MRADVRRGQHKGVFKAAIAALEFDLSRQEENAARTRVLIAQLRERSGQSKSSDAPSPRRERRRRRRKLSGTAGRYQSRRVSPQPTVKDKAVKARKTRGRRHAVEVSTAAAEPTPVTVRDKRVRGAAQFAEQLKTITTIQAQIAAAEQALDQATRAKDSAGITAASAEIAECRRKGGTVLRELQGRAKLPPTLTLNEKRKWWAAFDGRRTAWRVDADGTMSREIGAEA